MGEVGVSALLAPDPGCCSGHTRHVSRSVFRKPCSRRSSVLLPHLHYFAHGPTRRYLMCLLRSLPWGRREKNKGVQICWSYECIIYAILCVSPSLCLCLSQVMAYFFFF